MMKHDIQTIEDVQLMVNTFYERIQKNEVLGPIFEEKVSGRWPEHLEKMYRFWQTILLGEHTYNGAPFPPHARMPITMLFILNTPERFDLRPQKNPATTDKHRQIHTARLCLKYFDAYGHMATLARQT